MLLLSLLFEQLLIEFELLPLELVVVVTGVNIVGADVGDMTLLSDEKLFLML